MDKLVAFGLRFVPTQHHVARLMMYYLTGMFYNDDIQCWSAPNSSSRHLSGLFDFSLRALQCRLRLDPPPLHRKHSGPH
jgi:hypothetical protein